jgi:ankyrin
LPGTRRSSGTSSSLSANSRRAPNYNARAQLVEAINKGEKRDVERLLQQVDPNFHTDGLKELYPLHIAAEKGDLDIIGLLLYYKAKVDCYTQGGERRTPLMMALAMNHPVAAIFLISRGANVSHKDSEGQTALHIAARRNLYAATQVLLGRRADPNAYDTSGRTPLMEAVSRDDREVQPLDTHILRILLEYEANPTLGTLKDHITPLHHAACEGYTEDLHILVESAQSRGKWACSAQDLSGRSPLWFAARHGHFVAVKILLRLGENVNHRSQDDEFPTPLWAMASTGRLDAVSALLEAGADPNVRNAEGHTLLHMACRSSDEGLTQLLLKHNANPSIRDNDDMEPMHHAALKGSEAVILQLLECRAHKANVDCVDGSGTTPLIHAAENGHLRLLRYLIDRDANWKHRDDFGCDAFYIACAKGHILCATYLLGRGAEINMPNSKGNTPLHVAARMGHVETVRWLLYLGADTAARSIAPSDGMDKIGTPAEVARAANLDHDLAESIASMIEEFVPDNKSVAWKVEMTDPKET